MSKGLETLQEYRNKSGQKLYESGAVQQLDNDSFLVKSESNQEQVYFIENNLEGLSCNCPDFSKRGKYLSCKHIVSVKVYLTREL